MSQSSKSDEGGGRAGPDRVGDALRDAVERTLEATAGTRNEAAGRVQRLLDDVTDRVDLARSEVERCGAAARGEMNRRGGEAQERIADALAELRVPQGADLGPLAEQVAQLEERLAALETRLRSAAAETKGDDEDGARGGKGTPGADPID